MKTSTTISTFDKSTHAVEVAAQFPHAIKDRTILITGVNRAGIGYATAEAFASQSPKCLILAGRSRDKLNECVDALRQAYPSIAVDADIDIRTLVVDLSLQESIRSAAKTVMEVWVDVPTIDLVINNAGTMRHGEDFQGPIPKTKDGIEEMFAVNHLGHFLLTNLIMPKIIKAASSSNSSTPETEQHGGKPRIINVSSIGAFVSPLRASDLTWSQPTSSLPINEQPNLAAMRHAGMNVDPSTAYIPTAAYGHSKACNVLFSVGLNARLFHKYAILSLALNPGEVGTTELARNTDTEWLARAVKKREDMGMLYWKNAGQGAATTLVAACDPLLTLPEAGSAITQERSIRGYFLNDCKIAEKVPSHIADATAAEKLWTISEDLTGQKFDL